MNEHGLKTLRQAWEESFWFRWSKRLFDLWGDDVDGVSVEHDRQEFIFKKEDKQEGIAVQIFPVNAVMEKILITHRTFLTNKGYSVCDEKMKLSFNIDLHKDNTLVLNPVIIPIEGNQRDFYQIRIGSKITWYFSRPDFGQVWPIRLSETAVIAALFRGFRD